MSCILEENTNKTVLSTSFVHGTEFMKRRFENIFDARKKKVGVACITGVCSIVILLSGTMRIEENLLQNSAAKDEQNTELQTPTKEEV